MKKIILIVLSLVLFVACQSDKANPPKILDGRILFLGDSITQDGRYVSIIEYELFKHYPEADIDVISIGLSSETVSGLTEPHHPYPRPNVHERLGRALEKIKPQTVVACYGMNDGIYHPQSDERFQAYKDGIQKLIADVKAAGAGLIILTPPIFDPTVIPGKVVGEDAPQFGYSTPYAGYNDVLADYAKWLLTLKAPDVQVIDLNGPMLAFVKQQRESHPDFAISKDGVHPNFDGHALMARLFLQGIGVPLDDVDVHYYAALLTKDPLYRLVQQRRAMRSTAWLVDIGFNKPGNYKALPLDEAEKMAAEMKQQILERVKGEE